MLLQHKQQPFMTRQAFVKNITLAISVAVALNSFSFLGLDVANAQNLLKAM
jgi:hypothetical protein